MVESSCNKIARLSIVFSNEDSLTSKFHDIMCPLYKWDRNLCILWNQTKVNIVTPGRNWNKDLQIRMNNQLLIDGMCTGQNPGRLYSYPGKIWLDAFPKILGIILDPNMTWNNQNESVKQLFKSLLIVKQLPDT